MSGPITRRDLPSAYWDIYAEELLHYRCGYPLLVPEPDRSVSEVEIGDVGYLHEGGFYQLFNSMKAKGERQVHHAVPLGFEPFCPPATAIVGPRNKINQSFLCGRSIEQVDFHAGAAVSPFQAPAPEGASSAGIHFSFKSASDRGAFLALSPPAISKQLLSKVHIVKYMRENFDSWLEFANATIGLGLREEEIFFVSGTTKTNQWAVAAFSGHSRTVEGSFAANLGSVATTSVSISVSNTTLRPPYYGTGPSRRTSGDMLLPSIPPDTQAPSEEQRDQCIFINYYKMKRRFWKPLPMRAAGVGAHDSSSPGSEDFSGPESPLEVVNEVGALAEGDGDSKKHVDPVGYLLNYILENSTASYAAACDLDVYMLCEKAQARGIQSALIKTKPAIEVDGNGVGAIFLPPEYEMLLAGMRPGTQQQLIPHSHRTPPQPITGHTHTPPHTPPLSASSLESVLSCSESLLITPENSVGAPPAILRHPNESRAGFPALSVSAHELEIQWSTVLRTASAAQPNPGQANGDIIHTDDASTKLSDRVRRKCHNCHTTSTSSWQRSSLTPGKVLCNKCGLFERTHSRPRPVQPPHEGGAAVNTSESKPDRITSPRPRSISRAASARTQANAEPPVFF